MPVKEQTQSQDKAKLQVQKPASQGLLALDPQVLPPGLVQRALNHHPRLQPHEVLQLQRLTNNRTVGQLLDRRASTVGTRSEYNDLGRKRAAEAVAGNREPDQDRPDEEPRVTVVEVSATLRPGSETPETRLGGYTPSPDEIVAHETTRRQAVSPAGAPTLGAGGNNCTPGNEALDWNVQEAGENWRANVVALNISGRINLNPWPSNPSTMTTPNTPNPVDGGNINNTAGSSNQWQAAINDMADYDTAGVGGAGALWHSSGASSAHEWAHWNQDYLADCIPTGNWTGTNTDIDALTVAKTSAADAAAARTALEPRVTSRFRTFVRAVTARWNAIPDDPGAGGRGYAAGMGVLNGLIANIRAYATSKGWTGGGGPAPSP